MNAKQTVKGFTIIEVVLVLAIAGLIFLMVFVALPALQSGQRDTARKNDVSATASAVTNFTNNNRGQFPDTANLATQLEEADGVYRQLSGNTVDVTVVDSAPTSVEEGNIVVVQGVKCDTVAPEGVVGTADGTTRQFVVLTRLEGSGETGYCLDS